MINNKLKKFYAGMRENEFYKIVETKKQKANHMQKGDENAKSKLDLFFRC